MGFRSQAKFVLVFLVCNMFATPRSSRGQMAAVGMNVSEGYLKTAADQERAGLGLPPLRWDDALAAAAREHAAMMARHSSISHQYAGEPELASRAAGEGARFSLITENVAQAPTAVLVHSAWMHSEGHRHNLLDPNVDSVGIAVIARNGQMFAVEDFARNVAALSLRQQETEVGRVVRASGLVLAATSEDARQVCAGSPSSVMARSPEFVMRYTTADLERLPNDLTVRLHSGRYGEAIVAACAMGGKEEFSMYQVAVLLYRDRRPAY